MLNAWRWLVALYFGAIFTIAATTPSSNVVAESPIEGITKHRLNNGLRDTAVPHYLEPTKIVRVPADANAAKQQALQ